MSDSYSVDSTIVKLDAAIVEALYDIGNTLENSARQICPIDTGRLMLSISYDVNTSEQNVTIGSDVEYAPYVETRAHFLENASNKESSHLSNILAEKIKESR